MATLNLIYALKDGKTVHISDVDSGLKCGCICPACQKPLIAKKGTKRTPHFAHKNGGTCEYGYESSLHLAAKEIIAENKKVIIPPVYLRFPNICKISEQISGTKSLPIDDVKLETPYGGFIPDIVVYIGGKPRLFVEIYVTHPIDDEKLEKIKKAGISTIEIDLSKRDRTISKEELKKILLEESTKTQWKYNAYVEKKLQQFYSEAEEKSIIPLESANNTLHVKNCPLRKPLFEKDVYAHYRCDCLNCEYCISTDESLKKILCTGKKRISKIKDFDIPEDERIRASDERIEAEKKRKEKERKQREKRRIQWEAKQEEARERYQAYLAAPKCPYCNSKLIEPKNLVTGLWKCPKCGCECKTRDPEEY